MQLNNLIYKVIDKLNGIGVDQYDPKIAYRDLEDSWDTIQLIGDYLNIDITDYTAYPTSRVERCVIKLATYNAYRTYTRLSERQIGALPQGAPTVIAYDVIDAKSCLSMLFGVQITDELLPVVNEQNPVVSGSYGTSSLDE